MAFNTKRIAYLSLLAALTLVLGYLDAMIPLPVPVPGIKLGLANIAIIISLYLLGPRYAFALMLAKVAIASMLIGSPSMILYSFGGSFLAYLGMYGLWRTRRIHILAISVVSAVLHSLGQLGVASIMLQTPAILINFPIMAIAACVTGWLTGTIAQRVLEALEPSMGSKLRAVESENDPIPLSTSYRNNISPNPANGTGDFAQEEASSLIFDEVSFTYPNNEMPSLHSLSFSLSPGERVALIGLNGSGKSSLAQLANGLLIPSSGTVQIGNLNTADTVQVKRIRKLVGLVAQDPDSQILASTVFDDTAFGLENLGIEGPLIAEKVQEALSQVGLEGYEERDPHLLSGGEKQRLVIAGILVMEPQFIVFDEPYSMLDMRARGEVRKAVDALHAKGRGILHISHDIQDALVADKVLILDEGKLIFEGTPYELQEQSALMQQYGNVAVPEKSRAQQTPVELRTATSALELSDVGFSYAPEASGEHRTLSSIQLSLESGSSTLLVGQSGSGKSTLLRLAAGLMTPNEGKVAIDGRPFAIGSVGLVFQRPESQLFGRTVFEDIAFGPRNKASKNKATLSDTTLAETVRESLALVGLDYESYKDLSPFSLSGGEARRVAIAGILSMKPHYLLFDEPTAGLDYQGRAFFYRLMDALLEQGVGLLIVSHDLEEFIPRVDRALVLAEGKIRWQGVATDLCDYPEILREAKILPSRAEGAA